MPRKNRRKRNTEIRLKREKQQQERRSVTLEIRKADEKNRAAAIAALQTLQWSVDLELDACRNYLCGKEIRRPREGLILDTRATRPLEVREMIYLAEKLVTLPAELHKPDFLIIWRIHKAAGSFLRKPDEYRVRTRKRARRLPEIVEHLFLNYPIPDWGMASLLENTPAWGDVGLLLGRGNSLAEILPYAMKPVLTRKERHLLQTSKSVSPNTAVVEAFYVAAGGRRKSRPPWFRDIGCDAMARPALAKEYVGWLARSRLPDVNVMPVWDYVKHLRAIDPTWSIVGRSPGRLLAGMLRWHYDLQHARPVEKELLPDSGIPEWSNSFAPTPREDKPTRGTSVQVVPLRDTQALFDEGKALCHCVGGYAQSVRTGYCAIFSLRTKGCAAYLDSEDKTAYLDDGSSWERQLTIEVRITRPRATSLGSLRCVQVRGKYNRNPTKAENRWVEAWAREVGVYLGRGAGWV